MRLQIDVIHLLLVIELLLLSVIYMIPISLCHVKLLFACSLYARRVTFIISSFLLAFFTSQIQHN
jgi:membrane protein implicated in regulation of membrane protease activity